MNDMTQLPVRFGRGNALVGMVTMPANPAAAAPVACLMLNMGANHRVGPRRINVKLAHALAARGVSSLRMDLGGVGDSEAPDAGMDLHQRAVLDLQAAMDLMEDTLGIEQFAIMGMCSGAEHAMGVAAIDPRVTALSLFDGFAFPERRARWERTLRRALAAPAHPSFAGKTKRWIKRHVLRVEPARAMPGFFTEEVSREATARWFGQTMQQLHERRVAVQLLYSGSLHVTDRDRDQLGPFRRAPFAQALHYQFMREIDHTVCTTQGQQLFLQTVGGWLADRCAGATAGRPSPARVGSSADSTAIALPATLAAP